MIELVGLRPSQESAQTTLRHRLVTKIQQIREARIKQIKADNPFGFEVSEFRGLSEEEKKKLWKREGGSDFQGEVGEIRRYVVGFPQNIIEDINVSGFDINKKMLKGAIVPWIGGSEGKGVYATTNPKLASREYGPSLAIVDIALGKKTTVDNSFFLKVLDKTKELQRWTVGAYVASIVSFEALSMLVGARIYPQDAVLIASAFAAYSGHGIIWRFFQGLSGTDSMVISPNQLPTLVKRIPELLKGHEKFWDLVKKAEQHKEWVIVKDPARVKILNTFNSYDEYKQTVTAT